MENKYKVVLLTVLTLSVLTIAIVEIALAWRRDHRQADVSLYDRYNQRTYHGEIYPDQIRTRDQIVHDMPRTTVQFYETSHNFGVVSRGNVVRHSFRFKNTGENPLMIAKADVTCGCTVPSFPEDAISPGQEGELTVEVNTAKIDAKIFDIDKSVTVHANTNPEAITISVSGSLKNEQLK